MAHAQWMRRTAAAFDRPKGVVERWTETAAAAGYAPDGLPAYWSERETLLNGSGREVPTDADRAALGDRAELFPLLS